MIPEGWTANTLKDIAKVKGGKRMPKGKPLLDMETPFPYIRVSDFRNSTVSSDNLKFVHPDDQKSISRYTISSDDLYISIAGTLGLVGTIPKTLDGAQLTENAAKIMIQDHSKIDKEFLKFSLLSEQTQNQILKLKGTGGGVPKLALFRIESVNLHLPPLPEQKRIAEILASVDDAIQATEKVIEQTKKVKQGLLQELLTRGIGHTKFKKAEIGEIPESWEVGKLGDVARIVDPNPSHRYPPEDRAGIPLVSTADFIGDDEYRYDKCKYVPHSTYRNQLERCTFSEGDVVFARKGRIGFARFYGKEKKCFSHTVVIIKALDKLISDYLLWLVRSDYVSGRLTRTMNSNSGVPTLGVKPIAANTVPIPPLAEQELIGGFLNKIQNNISQNEHELERLKNFKSGLMQDLLTGRVRVRGVA